VEILVAHNDRRELPPTEAFAIAGLDGRIIGSPIFNQLQFGLDIKNQATNVIFNDKNLINIGTGVTEHRISCLRKYSDVGRNSTVYV
jgi:hypothetical protein